jgi:hypothetical protein
VYASDCWSGGRPRANASISVATWSVPMAAMIRPKL